jgi:hypothetical protein
MQPTPLQKHWIELNSAIAALKHEFPGLYQEVREALANQVFPEYHRIAPVLLKALLASPEEQVRLQAAKLLDRFGPRGGTRAVAAFLQVMRDKNAEIRLYVLSSLCQCHLEEVPEAADTLRQAMTDSDPAIRQRAIEAWRGLGLDLASEGLPDLTRALQDPVSEVRRIALAVLGWLGAEAEGAVTKILDLVLKDDDSDVRQAAAQALLQIDPEGDIVIPSIGQVTKTDDRKKIIHALCLLGPAARSLRSKIRACQKVSERPLSVPSAQSPEEAVQQVQPRKILRDAETEERDEWIYQQCCRGVAYKTIGSQLPSQNTHWSEMSKQGVLQAARRYAKRHSLPEPPPRQEH